MNKLVDIKNKLKNKKSAFISGNFNILHPGHLRQMKFAKDNAEILIVGINNDACTGVLLNSDHRLEAILSTVYVDFAFIIEGTIEEVLLELKPNIVVKGREFESKINIEQDIISSYSGKLLFSSGEARFSSLDLLRHENDDLVFNTISHDYDYIHRNRIVKEDLINTVKNISKLKIAVIGDVIVDEYITCEALGMSREDPTIVVSPLEKRLYIGGAGIVAAHASGLGANVSFFSVLGNSGVNDFIQEKMDLYNVDTFFLNDDTRPTTLKQRYRSGNKTLLRVNSFKETSIDSDIEKEFVKIVLDKIDKGIDLLIFSDFNYGVLTQNVVDTISTYAKKKNIIVSADSQTSSQVGDISRYTNLDLITPTEHEARVAFSDKDSGLIVLAEKLHNKTNNKNIFVTMGEEGVLIHSENKKLGNYKTETLRALNEIPKDVAGAGDSMLVASSLSLVYSDNIFMSAYIGAIAAACQVGKVGNMPLSVSEIIEHIEKLS